MSSSNNKKRSFNYEISPATWFYTPSALNRVRAYLGNVREGQPKVYTAPFAKGQSMDEVLKDWNTVLVSIQDKWPSLYEFENDLAKKVGPMSVQKPISERMDDISHYYEDILLSSTPVDPMAIHCVTAEFLGLSGLRLRSARETVDLMKKSTNSGSPYFTKRRNVVRETLRSPTMTHMTAKGRVVCTTDDDTRDVYELVATVGWRGQEGGPSEEDVKQRVVWMFPFGINILELEVYQPLIEGAQRLHYVPAWESMDAVDRRITQLFDTKNPDDLIVCTDFSRFDQHFNKHMSECAKTILTRLLTKDARSEEWLRDIFPIKYTIPLCIGWEDDHVGLCRGLHGMGSGSGGTNVDETLAHRALQWEVALRHGAKLNPNSQCLGDDGILSYPGITVEDVVESYSSHGQECNADKQYASTQDCVYLRRWHHNDYRKDGICVGVYSTNRALGRLRYLERFMDPAFWSPEMVALRQLSIINNCEHHPLREEFVHFCMKRDKYRLGIDIPGFFDNITEIAIEATSHMQDFLGYTKTLQGEGPQGIKDWWVVKYLNSQR